MGLETMLTGGHATRKIFENPTVIADTLPKTQHKGNVWWGIALAAPSSQGVTSHTTCSS